MQRSGNPALTEVLKRIIPTSNGGSTKVWSDLFNRRVMPKLKKGIYMGPTAELFLLTTPKDAPEFYASNSDTHILITLEQKLGSNATDTWSLPGQEVEFQRLLAGFSYLGKL